MKAWLRVWWPVLVWAALISVFSTDFFSWQHTSRIVVPLIKWLFPSFNPHQINEIHALIRKSAHFTEYFVFCVLLFRSIRGARAGWRWSWGLAALLMAAGYSVLDEVHQAFVASRTASPFDSMLDTFGASCAVLVLWLWFRPRSRETPAADAAEAAGPAD